MRGAAIAGGAGESAGESGRKPDGGKREATAAKDAALEPQGMVCLTIVDDPAHVQGSAPAGMESPGQGSTAVSPVRPPREVVEMMVAVRVWRSELFGLPWNEASQMTELEKKPDRRHALRNLGRVVGS